MTRFVTPQSPNSFASKVRKAVHKEAVAAEVARGEEQGKFSASGSMSSGGSRSSYCKWEYGGNCIM